MLTRILAIPLVLISSGLALAGGRHCQLQKCADNAVCGDAKLSAAAIAELRNAGPAGLEYLRQRHAKLLAEYDASAPGSDALAKNPVWPRLCAAFDAVGRARDNYAARLYWYTDFEQAKAAARAAGKPILSLRLLGNLDDEFSCANSRFFRTVLYAGRRRSRSSPWEPAAPTASAAQNDRAAAPRPVDRARCGGR